MSEPVPVEPTKDQLKQALKAFKKRLKLAQLDDESRMTRSPLTGGQPSGIIAIQAPSQFSKEIWDELVRQRKLKKAGIGIYELGPEANNFS
jgi:hypothetical protein